MSETLPENGIPDLPGSDAITQSSKSNLALAFISLGRERRQDMTTFYAFCRIVDDIADTDQLTADEKQKQLNKWRGWLTSRPSKP